MTISQTDKWFTAAVKGDIAAIRSMIVAGMDLDVRDQQERTVFHIASQNADTDMMTTILAARKMNFLRQIGVDPFAAPQQDEGQDKETGTAKDALRAVRRA